KNSWAVHAAHLTEVLQFKTIRRSDMRFIVFVKADKNSENGIMPDEKLLSSMMAFNEELVKAGVMEAGEGLHPSSKGVRLEYGKDKSKVVQGPFPVNEVVAGFWIWKVKSHEDALAWAKRAPFGPAAVLELRPIFEAEDFGAALTPELRDKEERLRAKV